MSNIHRRKICNRIAYPQVALATLPLIGVLAVSNRVSAQIVPSGTGASTIVNAADGVYNIDGGQISKGGENLFHGFEQFNLDTEQTANFMASPEVKNIIGSVEGGAASTINGTLQVSGSDANLYLINPAGILFGSDVQLNLAGGITATTADGIDFENEQFFVGESFDYSKLSGSPTAFRFTKAEASAVINLGDLQVNPKQFISLTGGTVINSGSLEAPDGTVSIGAVEGGKVIQLSQKEHLLSLEVIADEIAASSGFAIPPVEIAEMLTGSGASNAAALLTDADGTVRLASTDEIIERRGGYIYASGVLSTAGESGGNVNVLGKRLSLETAVLDASGSSDRGLIQIDADNIVVTDEVVPTASDTTTYLSSGFIEGLSSRGNLDIAATSSFLIEEISDGDLTFERGASVALTADSDKDLEGAFTVQSLPGLSTPTNAPTIRAERGRLEISGAGITAGAIRTDTTGNRGQGGGSITLSSSRGISVDSIASNTYFAGNNAGDGGNIRIEAGSEGITVREGIKTWSYSDGGNNAGNGGNIDLRAEGDIVVGELFSVSVAGKNSAGSGGQIAVGSTAGSVTVTGDIRSSSRAEKNNASAGGDIAIVANNNIDIRGAIDTSSTARNSNADNAGSVSLEAGNSVLVRSIDATSSKKDRDGSILLRGDRIDLLGGENSVSGGSLWFRPSSQNQDINVGISSDTEVTLDISTTDLEAIKLAQSIDIGDSNSTGDISLFSEDIETISNQFPVRILGGDTLSGSDISSIWTVNSLNQGSVNNFLFENIGNLEGGAGDDVFTFSEDGFLSGSISGGGGFDTLDLRNSRSNHVDFSEIENVLKRDVERETSEEITNQEALQNPIVLENPETNTRLEIERAMMDNINLSSIDMQQVLTSTTTSDREATDSGSIEADVLRFFQVDATEALAIADTFDRIEASIGAKFTDYLGLSKVNDQVETVDSVQQRLRDVETATGKVPALVYAYFVPDVESESSAVIGSDRAPHSNDRLEVMLITQADEPIRTRQWEVTREQLETASRTLRQEVTSQFSTERQYLPPAQQLYDWILRPISKELENRGVESVGFVMDDGLRTLPIAALHNGDRYLVEDYSLGILPSFSLTKFKNTDREEANLETVQVLAMGASEFDSQPPLPAVDAEIDIITQQLWQGDAFLNEDFVLENLQNRLAQKDYGIVHLATHASFESDDLENSYIQMWDDKLSLSDMQTLGLSNSDVSLIILSACNTALGDRASEYGFAGFAVTAGSESALASLWPVSDEGTLGFMSRFYRELQQSPVKSEALRQAQISLLSGNVGIADGVVYGLGDDVVTRLPELEESGRWTFSHPFYWSAFTMIGNPW